MTGRRCVIATDGVELRTHDHTAWCGDGPRELHDLAASAFRAAAQRTEKLLFICEDPRREWLTALDGVDRLIDRGTLRLVAVDEAYAHADEPADQRASFEAELDAALADGYTGLCVVADNSPFVEGSNAAFADWLAWEAVADQLQDARPITGLCYFDRRRVSADRLLDIAALHPVRSASLQDPGFQIFADGDVLRALGDFDGLNADRTRRIVRTAVEATGLPIDISRIDFIDHMTLRELNDMASSGTPVRVRGATDLMHRVWALLDVRSPALEFC